MGSMGWMEVKVFDFLKDEDARGTGQWHQLKLRV